MAIEILFTNPALPAPSNPFEAVFFWILLTPIAIVLQFLSNAFAHFGVTAAIGSFGVAIIALTLIIRGLLFPLFRWQIGTQWKIQDQQRRLAPELKEIQQRYKKDKPKLQEETMALYRRHQINPLSQLSGCLPLVIQMPFIYALFGSIKKLSTELHGHVGFLWIPNLQEKALTGGIGGLASHPTLIIVPILAGVLTFAQSKMMMQPPRPDMTDQERQMQRVMGQTTYLMPVMIAVFALNFAQGIGLYWITQSAVMVLQVFFMMGWGGLKVPSWFPGAGWIPPKSPRGRLATLGPDTGPSGMGFSGPSGNGGGRSGGPVSGGGVSGAAASSPSSSAVRRPVPNRSRSAAGARRGRNRPRPR